MNAPQIIVLVLVFIGLLISANKHGQVREPHNFWVSLFATIIELAVLYWGGFFK